jgi:hypothetical protein
MSKKSADKDKKEKKSTSKKPDEKKPDDETELGNKQFALEEDEEEKKGKVGTALQKFTRDQSYMMNVQQFLEVKGEQVHIRSRDCLANIRSLVLFQLICTIYSSPSNIYSVSTLLTCH